MAEVESRARPVSRRRQERLKEEQVRDRMFVAARDLLRVQGVRITLEDLGLDDVVYRAGVSRSSVYRIWPYKADFVADLLRSLAGMNWMGNAAFDTQTLILAAETVLGRWDDLAEPETRRALLVDVVTAGVQRNYQALLESDEWYIYIALEVTARGPEQGGDEHDIALAKLIGEAARGFIDGMSAFYEAIGPVLGLRLRIPGASYRHLAAAGGAVVEGLVLQRMVSNANQGTPDFDSPWSLRELVEGPLVCPESGAGHLDLVSLAFLAILDSLTEPTPDYIFSAETRSQFEAKLKEWRHRLEEVEAKFAEARSGRGVAAIADDEPDA